MDSELAYRNSVRNLFAPAESAHIKKLSTPEKIQDYLDAIPFNFETKGETLYSPRHVLRTKTAHCFEGALLAAASLAYHGARPLLMDLQSRDDDFDHVVALFVQDGYWGAISKTNHAVLRWRDPVYKTPRELAMSFFHEYFIDSGEKTMTAFSRPFDLRRYAPERWVTADGYLAWLAEALDSSLHFPVAPRATLRRARRASMIEKHATGFTEWDRFGLKKKQ